MVPYLRETARPGSRQRREAFDRGNGLADVRGEGQPAARHRAVSRHPGIKRKGLALSWLTHCRNRLALRWMIRSRS